MKKALLLLFILLGNLAVAQTTGPVKREVIGRDVGQLKGIRITGRILDTITGEALVGATVTVPELNITLYKFFSIFNGILTTVLLLVCHW